MDLSGNPVQQHKLYHLHVRTSLTKLQHLDGCAARHLASDDDGILSEAIIKTGATLWQSEAGKAAKYQQMC